MPNRPIVTSFGRVRVARVTEYKRLTLQIIKGRNIKICILRSLKIAPRL